MRGRFITLEGIEGTGKSTNLDFVADLLRQAGKEVVVTREPGGTPLAESIRALLLADREEVVPPAAETLLMFAARSVHTDNLIRPALERGAWVVCDRYTDATFAYQGGGRGEAPERIAALEGWVQRGLAPDLTLLLDITPEEGLARAGRRGGADRFEREAQAFFLRARAVYLERARNEPERIRMVDASRPLSEVQDDIRNIINKLIQVIDKIE